jgi:hypothetical protein
LGGPQAKEFDCNAFLELGFRGIAYYQVNYLISAGAYHGGGPFRFYRWAGVGTLPQAIPTDDLGDYHPEAIIIYPGQGLREIQILSDDGKRVVKGVSNRDLSMHDRSFRSFFVGVGPQL